MALSPTDAEPAKIFEGSSAPKDGRSQAAAFFSTQYLTTCALLTVLYFAGAKIGHALAYFGIGEAAIWPPAGIALAALLSLGYHVWPAIFLGAFLGAVTTFGWGSALAAAGSAAGSTLAPLCAAYLVRRYAGGRYFFYSAWNIFKFACLESGCAALGALVSVTALGLAGIIEWPSYERAWQAWWFTSAVGGLVLTPVLLAVWIGIPRQNWTWLKRLEAATVALGLTLVTYMVFGLMATPHSTWRFLCIPFLLWSAFRFEKFGAALTLLLFSLVSVWTVRNIAPPMATVLEAGLLIELQAFIGVIGLMTLAVAATVSQRQRAEEMLRKDQRVLQEQVHVSEEALTGAEQALQRNEVILSHAEKLAHLGSFQWDPFVDRFIWSGELCRIYGRTSEGAVGTLDEFLSYTHPHDRSEALASMQHALREGKAFQIRNRIVRGNGEVRVLSSRGEVEKDAEGHVIRLNGVSRDVTEEHRAEKVLQELAGKLIGAQEKTLKGVGRELHDHVSQKLGLLAINIDHVRTDPAVRDMSAARELDAVSTQIGAISKDVHELSHRLHSSMLDYLGLVPALQGLVDEFSRRVGITLKLEIGTAPVRISSDVALCLFRIAEESLANVAKHSGARWTAIRLDSKPERICLSIEDGGAGFDPQRLDGSGLGLISMRERLRLVQGTLRITSSPSKGTRVEACVPRKTLLLVEDNPGDAGLIRRMTAEMSEHFRLTHVTSLSQALDHLEHAPVDVVILDLNLPDSLGPQTLARVRDSFPAVPVVVISGDWQREAVVRALGTQTILWKDGLTTSLLLQAIRRETGLESRNAASQEHAVHPLDVEDKGVASGSPL